MILSALSFSAVRGFHSPAFSASASVFTYPRPFRYAADGLESCSRPKAVHVSTTSCENGRSFSSRNGSLN